MTKRAGKLTHRIRYFIIQFIELLIRIAEHDHQEGTSNKIGLVERGNESTAGSSAYNPEYKAAALFSDGHRAQLGEKGWVCIVSDSRPTQRLPLLHIL